MRILLDTCIVLDYLEDREPFFDDALNIMISIANGEAMGCITASSITDIYYILHQHTHDDKLSRKALEGLLSILTIADTTAEDCINALASKSKDFEDAVIIETASRCKIDYIVTRNKKDYAKSKLPALTPAEFLDILDA